MNTLYKKIFVLTLLFLIIQVFYDNKTTKKTLIFQDYLACKINVCLAMKLLIFFFFFFVYIIKESNFETFFYNLAIPNKYVNLRLLLQLNMTSLTQMIHQKIQAVVLQKNSPHRNLYKTFQMI